MIILDLLRRSEAVIILKYICLFFIAAPLPSVKYFRRTKSQKHSNCRNTADQRHDRNKHGDYRDDHRPHDYGRIEYAVTDNLRKAAAGEKAKEIRSRAV